MAGKMKLKEELQMTESQYRRANRTVFILVTVILTYFILIMGATALRSGGNLQTYLRAGMVALMYIGTVIFYMTGKGQKKAAIGMMACATVAYAVIVLFGENTIVYAYAFPVLFGAMVSS